MDTAFYEPLTEQISFWEDEIFGRGRGEIIWSTDDMSNEILNQKRERSTDDR
jgi:hypothetical protein